MADDLYERLLVAALQEVDRKIVDMVDRAFEWVPHGARKLPIIGGDPFLNLERAVQKEKAIAACRARAWVAFSAPEWVSPLPLTDEDCRPLANSRNSRQQLRGKYGLYLRQFWWDLSRASKFELFCEAGAPCG